MWPTSFDKELVQLWERTKQEVPTKAAKDFESFLIAVVLNGKLAMEQALDQAKRQTNLIELPKGPLGQYVGRRTGG